MHRGTVDLNRIGQIGVVVGAGGRQSLKTVAQYFGSAIAHDSLFRQTRDGLQVAAVFVLLERVLNVPAVVIEVAEMTAWEKHHIKQLGHQYMRPPIGRDMARQPQGLWLVRAFKVGRKVAAT